MHLPSLDPLVFHAENLSGSVKGFERNIVKVILCCHIQRFCASDGVANLPFNVDFYCLLVPFKASMTISNFQFERNFFFCALIIHPIDENVNIYVP